MKETLPRVFSMVLGRFCGYSGAWANIHSLPPPELLILLSRAPVSMTAVNIHSEKWYDNENNIETE